MTDKTGWLIVKRENLGPKMLTPYDVSDRFYVKGDDQETPKPVRCWHMEINRPTGKTVGGIFNVVERTGKHDTANVQIGISGHSRSVPYTAAGIKTVLRRVRGQEAQAITDAEQEIERLTSALEAARCALKAAQAEAFARGNVVRLAEVEAVVTPRKDS